MIENFEEQLTVVRDNYNETLNKLRSSKKEWPHNEPVNNILTEFHLPTDTLLEKKLSLTLKSYPYGLERLKSSYYTLAGFSFKEYFDISNFLNAFRKFLESVEIKNVRHFQLNLLRNDKEMFFEHEKSIKDFILGGQFKRDDHLSLKVFLITTDRIKILSQTAYGGYKNEDGWTVNQYTNEFILKKDIKEVSTINSTVVFRNRVHSAWEIHTESLKKAIELSNIITELR